LQHPGELLSSIARFRFARRNHPKPKLPVRLLKNSERVRDMKVNEPQGAFFVA